MIKVRITLFEGEPFENVDSVVTASGGLTVVHVDQPRNRKIVAMLQENTLVDTIRKLAFLDEVAWIQAYPDYALCNDYTQWVCQSGPYSGG